MNLLAENNDPGVNNVYAGKEGANEAVFVKGDILLCWPVGETVSLATADGGRVFVSPHEEAGIRWVVGGGEGGHGHHHRIVGFGHTDDPEKRWTDFRSENHRRITPGGS